MAEKVFHPFEEDHRPEAVIGGAVRHHAASLPGDAAHPRLIPGIEGDSAERFRAAALGRELVVEVGPGKGLFLTRLAARHPSRLFLGVDVRLGFCLRTISRADAAHLDNVWVAYGDARLMLPALVKDGSAAEAYLLFPDPWWKRRHAPRRHGSVMAEVLARVLQPGGLLVIKSDIEGYLDTMRATFVASTLFDVAEALADLPRTDREDRIVPAGVPVFTAAFIRR